MPVYLDHNATIPFDSRALEAMMPHLTEHHGQAFERASLWPRAAIDRVREQVADLVNAHPGQVIFMNDGTQAGNFAIKGVAAQAAQVHQLRCVARRAVG